MEDFEKAAKLKYDKLRLTVHTNNNRAIGFYKKHGWHEINKTNESIRFELDLTS